MACVSIGMAIERNEYSILKMLLTYMNLMQRLFIILSSFIFWSVGIKMLRR